MAASPTTSPRSPRCLGRPPHADFDVVRPRRRPATPVVVRNAPFTRDGTPMPTRYWLVDRDAAPAVSRLEAAGGVRAAQAAVDPDVLQAAHDAYAAERDAAIPATTPGRDRRAASAAPARA